MIARYRFSYSLFRYSVHLYKLPPTDRRSYDTLGAKGSLPWSPVQNTVQLRRVNSSCTRVLLVTFAWTYDTVCWMNLQSSLLTSIHRYSWTVEPWSVDPEVVNGIAAWRWMICALDVLNLSAVRRTFSSRYRRAIYRRDAAINDILLLRRGYVLLTFDFSFVCLSPLDTCHIELIYCLPWTVFFTD